MDKPKMHSPDLVNANIEQSRIECARRLFADLDRRIAPGQVTYDVLDGFAKLRALAA